MSWWKSCSMTRTFQPASPSPSSDASSCRRFARLLSPFTQTMSNSLSVVEYPCVRNQASSTALSCSMPSGSSPPGRLRQMIRARLPSGVVPDTVRNHHRPSASSLIRPLRRSRSSESRLNSAANVTGTVMLVTRRPRSQLNVSIRSTATGRLSSEPGTLTDRR